MRKGGLLRPGPYFGASLSRKGLFAHQKAQRVATKSLSSGSSAHRLQKEPPLPPRHKWGVHLSLRGFHSAQEAIRQACQAPRGCPRGRAVQTCRPDLPEVLGRHGAPSRPARTVRVAYPELALGAMQSQAPQPHGQVVDTQAAVAVDVEGLEEAPQAQPVVRAPADGAAARVHGRLRRGGRRGGCGGVRGRGSHAAAQHTAHHRARSRGAGAGGGPAGRARRHAGVLRQRARAPRCRQAGRRGRFREPRPAARRLAGHASRRATSQSQARTATREGRGLPEDCPHRSGLPESMERAGRSRLSLGPIQTEGGGDWLSRAGERKSRRDRQKSYDWQAEDPVSGFH